MSDIPRLLDAILVHHAFLRRELDRLDTELVGAPRQIAAPFAHFRRSMIEHMDHEEAEIFPAIRAFAAGHLAAADLPALHEERDAIGTFELSLREAARDAGRLEADLLAMLDDLAEHVRKEDEELVPAVAALVRERAGPAAAMRPPTAAPPPTGRPAPRPIPIPPPAPARAGLRGGLVGLARRMWGKAHGPVE